MDNKEIFGYIDHTKLSPVSTWEEIKKLCTEAITYKTASVCIPPCYIEAVKESFPEVRICTVIGFPLGYMTKEAKAFEATDAVTKGADEIDMVVKTILDKISKDQLLEALKAKEEKKKNTINSRKNNRKNY